mmetsp:Transcript_37855/g.64626  ORF Transcript_37855/g.64626 Transcript_37855/m.64626 type:complete len:82 (-) Transcript_37855:572-817(-)
MPSFYDCVMLSILVDGGIGCLTLCPFAIKQGRQDNIAPPCSIADCGCQRAAKYCNRQQCVQSGFISSVKTQQNNSNHLYNA